MEHAMRAKAPPPRSLVFINSSIWEDGGYFGEGLCVETWSPVVQAGIILLSESVGGKSQSLRCVTDSTKNLRKQFCKSAQLEQPDTRVTNHHCIMSWNPVTRSFCLQRTRGAMGNTRESWCGTEAARYSTGSPFDARRVSIHLTPIHPSTPYTDWCRREGLYTSCSASEFRNLSRLYFKSWGTCAQQ